MEYLTVIFECIYRWNSLVNGLITVEKYLTVTLNDRWDDNTMTSFTISQKTLLRFEDINFRDPKKFSSFFEKKNVFCDDTIE